MTLKSVLSNSRVSICVNGAVPDTPTLTTAEAAPVSLLHCQAVPFHLSNCPLSHPCRRESLLLLLTCKPEVEDVVPVTTVFARRSDRDVTPVPPRVTSMVDPNQSPEVMLPPIPTLPVMLKPPLNTPNPVTVKEEPI